jgi:C4-dicarboxylate transporter
MPRQGENQMSTMLESFIASPMTQTTMNDSMMKAATRPPRYIKDW